jgi:uncharacterized protein with von Willebrand factor type A (vWA) domain
MSKSVRTFGDVIVLQVDTNGDVSETTLLPAEVSKLLEAYSRSILNSDS